MDYGNWCFSALPFFDLHHTLLAVCLAFVAHCIPVTPTYPSTHLASSAASLPAGVMTQCFPTTTDDAHCVGSSRDGITTRLARYVTRVAHAPGFLTKVSNLRFRSMLAQYHRHKTHTGCWNELEAYCSAPSGSQRLWSCLCNHVTMYSFIATEYEVPVLYLQHDIASTYISFLLHHQ